MVFLRKNEYALTDTCNAARSRRHLGDPVI